MRFLLNIFILVFATVAGAAQENMAIHDLLVEAESKLEHKPQEAGKIAEYIISQKENAGVTAEAMLLLARSFYVRGNFNDAAKNALEARKTAEGTEDVSKQLKTTFFAIRLLRELDLGTVADHYLIALRDSKKEINDERLLLWYSGKMKQDSAFAASKMGALAKATVLLSQAESIFKSYGDSTSVGEVRLARAEINLKTSRPDSARIYLEKKLEDIRKKEHDHFQQLRILQHLGSHYFTEKEYQRSLGYFQEQLAISVKLPNKTFKNKAAEGLALNYLALEDAPLFYASKLQANATAIEVETDKNQAVNTVYNFTNNYEKELSAKKLKREWSGFYVLAGGFLLLLLGGVVINYMYASKTRQYQALWKYIQPNEPVLAPKIDTEKLEKSPIVPEEIEQLLLQKLNKFETGKKFTNPDMSIALLASQFDTNTKYLSEVINRQKGKNFNSYINELRINYIIEKLKTDAVYFNYKVSYLAEESGFSSHSSFATVFKSVTGISPTKFMEFLQKRKETA